MVLAINQPYIFPYVGYFHLIEACDKMVFYDDVNYIKQGWINRNNILLNGTNYLVTIPVIKASQNKLIREIEPFINPKFRNKLYKLLKYAYHKAPFYDDAMQLFFSVIDAGHDNIADLAIDSVRAVFEYLGKDLNFTRSSLCSPSSRGMGKSERIIKIVKDNGFDKYINAIGGTKLYDKEYFRNRGVELNFVQSGDIVYKQYDNEFVPRLSILDVLMFNDKDDVNEILSQYSLV